MTIWFGINEYHFECKGDINRRNCTVVQENLKVAVGCPAKCFSPTELLVLSRNVAWPHV